MRPKGPFGFQETKEKEEKMKIKFYRAKRLH